MNLKKSILTSFLLVSILPLLLMSAYLFFTNVRLAFDLYGQDLYNSTEIQVDVVEEHITRLMVRSQRFALSRPIQTALASGIGQNLLNSADAAGEIQKFTDETLDSVLVFALTNKDGDFLYSSGSNSDVAHLAKGLPKLMNYEGQYVCEIPLGEKLANLAIVTPVKGDSGKIGMFVVIVKNDFFLKTISTHRQVESSNAFLYCQDHHLVVEAKRHIDSPLDEFSEKATSAGGSLHCTIDEEESLVYFRAINHTPWLLANSIPIRQIYTRILSYGLVSLATLGFALLAIVLLGRRQSTRILQPLNRFMDAAEQFFTSGASAFPQMELDKKTEIGYLADKFAIIASENAEVQEKLRESSYLYNALLHASYEVRLIIDHEKNSVACTSADITARLERYAGMDAAEQVMSLYKEMSTVHSQNGIGTAWELLSGKLSAPAEAEMCVNMGSERNETWYRVIAVPIIDATGQTTKTVLHYEDITDRKQEELKLLHSSQRDGLTGLLNKSAFDHLSQLLVRSRNSCDAMFFIDLNHFKQVNDTLGHAAGDEVLAATGKVLCALFRTTDLIARYGGDEFVIFAPNMPRAKAEMKANEITSKLSFRIKGFDETTLYVTGSVGVFLSTAQTAPHVMVREADAAMYRAKQRGDAQYQIEEEIK